MNTKNIHHIHPHSPFPCAHPPHWYPLPRKDLFYPPALHFSKCMLMVQGDFTLVLQACIYYAWIKLTPLLLTLSLTPCSPNIQ
jgi:hypothetical protein